MGAEGPDSFDAFVDYVAARFTEDSHLWVITLLEELRPFGFTGSYPTLTRQIRTRALRPACTACSHVTKAYPLVGSLAHSGIWRAVLSPSMDVPHLLATMTTLLALLGGLTKVESA